MKESEESTRWIILRKEWISERKRRRPMILSVSRRTDIPNYYSDWFYERIREGFLYVRNPMNPHQVSRIALSPELIDCIVFWTKNPKPMMARLGELSGYPYYFQFTLTGYGADIEPGVPHKRMQMIPIFKELADRIGSERVIWRYDPIFFNKTYTKEYHERAFEEIAGALRGYTKKCVISFVDLYAKNRKNMAALDIYEPGREELQAFAGKLTETAHANQMEIASCAEKIDLSACGILPNCCIDQALIEKITGCRIEARKDSAQRAECGCIESVEVGSYHTCRNGCKYCYANAGEERVQQSVSCYDRASPLLCGKLTDADKITERRMKSLRDSQISCTDFGIL